MRRDRPPPAHCPRPSRPSPLAAGRNERPRPGAQEPGRGAFLPRPDFIEISSLAFNPAAALDRQRGITVMDERVFPLVDELVALLKLPSETPVPMFRPL